ncbi:MAG: hypothetical protein H0W86_08120, partial [Armatimonadetes bacterium]|nr:hypothetical protein [Armatimonadota bacterium]
YVLLIDVFALFWPRLEAKWFGDIAEEEVSEDDWVPGQTTIPFCPYLAFGAILVAMFGSHFSGWLNSYWEWAMKR